MRKWLLVVFVAAVVIYLVLVLLGGNSSNTQKENQFRGPTGVPAVRGPSEPTPGAN